MSVAGWSGFVARRWPILAILAAATLLLAFVPAAQAYTARGYSATGQIFISIAPSPATPSSTSPLTDAEDAARLLASDLTEVAGSRLMAVLVASYLRQHGVQSPSVTTLQQSTSATAAGSTLTLTVSNRNRMVALVGVQAELFELSHHLSSITGSRVAGLSTLRVIGVSGAVRAAARPILTDVVLRLILGLLVTFGVAVAWDYLDGSVRGSQEIARLVGVPILARVGR